MSSSTSRKHRRIGSSSRSTSNGAHLLPEPPPSIFPSDTNDILKLLAVLALAALVALACNSLFARRRHQIAPTPFCDTASDAGPYHHDLDYCETCPEHGECSKGELMGCVFGYKRVGRACVEDGKFHRTAKKFADWMEHRVCEARVKSLCDGISDVRFCESDVVKLMEEIKTKEDLGLDDATLSMIKQEALKSVEETLDARVGYDGAKEFVCPDHMIVLYKPFLCSFKHWIYERARLVSSISILLACGVMLFWKTIKAKQLNARAEQLYQQVCEILEENAAMSVISEPSQAINQPWVVYSWLRDHLLLPRERLNPVVWKKVEELIQHDSRIDQYPKLIKGESRIVLEWQVKGSLSTKMRKRGKEATGLRKPSDAHVDHPGHEDRSQEVLQSLYS